MESWVRKSKNPDLSALLSPCRVCPRECGADRLGGETGFCGVGLELVVAAFSLHHGEEPPLSGRHGAGNIFFTGCNLRCPFCQNYPISQLGVGRPTSLEELAAGMLRLQKKGAQNINLVTPTHVAPQVAEAVELARDAGLCLPVVYNTNGYEKEETLLLLEGIVDIYLPDAKYGDEELARRISGAADYVSLNRKALDIMFEQVGHLRIGEDGLARRGLIVRHLVLPGCLSDTGRILNYLSGRFGPDLFVSLMSQYFPAHRVLDDPLLGRRLTGDEYRQAMGLMEKLFQRGWFQELL